MPVRSMTRAISPPRASISLTRCPLATPPMAGLHDIWATVSTLPVRTSVRAPSRAAMRPASQPAWPAPITITSYGSGKTNTALVAGGAPLVAFFRAGRIGRRELVDVEGEVEEQLVGAAAIRHAAGLPAEALDLGRPARVVLAAQRSHLSLPVLERLDLA